MTKNQLLAQLNQVHEDTELKISVKTGENIAIYEIEVYVTRDVTFLEAVKAPTHTAEMLDEWADNAAELTLAESEEDL